MPSAPHTLAPGTTRRVGTDQTIRFGSVRYSTPPGLVGAEVWVRVAGTELVIVADLDALPQVPRWATGRRGLAEVAGTDYRRRGILNRRIVVALGQWLVARSRILRTGSAFLTGRVDGVGGVVIHHMPIYANSLSSLAASQRLCPSGPASDLSK
ncbi:Mu transposase domain-containing protein [Rhodococcus zopfii]|uniref:Mu transposase domain-containing protein n=1 Tax=Rhodococcus zopfii TaxID=43772 RepID=UPI003557C6CD